ncbi:hypothetical protein DL96DRAFT_1630152 [Flagelloscypha sp. PMI_526]|nr:hypothetical protein DL96DRAFT_1630152 [Flagelloscypha sp. PMI_526]
MRKSQSKDLQSFFGTLVAHGNPRAQSQLGRNTVLSASRLDTSLNAAGTTLQLAKDAGDVAKEVPYVKAVAGVLSQIIKVREEIQANKERCGEIIDLVQLKSTTILQSLDKVFQANGAEGIEDLRSDLERYADFLRAVLREELEPFRTQSRWSSYIHRGKNSGDLQRLERELDEFNNRFSVKRLVEISVALLPKPSPPARVIPQALPPSPKLVIGRDSVVDSVVQTTLSSSEPRVIILGQGGIGKTTVATAVLHDSRITSVYPTIYFVSSELTPTIELLENRIADTLSIPQGGRGTDLVSQIVDRICQDPHPVLLCIDNLETVWEIEAEQPKVHNFLEVLSGTGSKLALFVTMRGTQTPNTSFPWNSTILSGLDIDDSVAMYENFSNELADGPACELLDQLSGSPLAIKLFSRMVQEGDRSSQLLASWNEHGTKALEIGSKHRLSSLERSIHLSVFSPRLNDTARLVLGLIALMPDGLSTSATWFKRFESVLPNETVLQSTLRALRRTALLDQFGEPSRWRMLPPIRQFCLQFADSTSPIVISLVELYMETVTENSNYSSSASQVLILPEMANIRGLLLHGSNMEPFPRFIGKASAVYVDWAYLQDIDESAILSCFLRLPILDNERADIYQVLGKLNHHWNRLDAAEISFVRALKLYSEAENQLGAANTHKSMGDLHARRHRLDSAEASFSRALILYREIPNRWGEADTHESMGELHMRQGRLDAAQTSLAQALIIHCEVQNRMGEANAHESMGTLHMRRDQLDAAEASLALALTIHGEMHNRLGEANVHEAMGNLHMRRDQLNAAEVSFSQALSLYGEIQHQWGQAITRESIGYLHLRRNRLDLAKISFSYALEQYNEIHDQWGYAACTFVLGQVSFQLQDLESAESAFRQALSLWENIGNNWGIAETCQEIGNLHLQRMQLDDAEASLDRALDIYTTKIQSRVNEALTNRSIGELHILRGQFKDSERAFQRALDLDVAANNRQGQGQSHRCLGRMFLKAENLKAAESSYTEALRLFFEIGDSQATPCLLDLGEVWVQLGKVEETHSTDVVFLRARWDAINQERGLEALDRTE